MSSTHACADHALGVAAVLRQYKTAERESGFVYHLELSYECQEPGAERFVFVQLRSSPDSPDGQEDKVAMFLLRKVCPTQPPDTGRLLLALSFVHDPSMVKRVLS